MDFHPASIDPASAPKSVQQMSINGDEPPPQYLVKNTNSSSIDESSPLPQENPFPIIDISILSSPPSESSKSDFENELKKLKSAFSSVGCIQAIGHGIPNSMLDKIRDVGIEFFALPTEEKQKYARAVNEFEGYGNDVIVSDKQVLDWSYRLLLKVFPEHKRRLNLWPKNPNDFSDTLEEFSLKTKTVNEILYKAMARALDLEENSFLDHFGDESMMQARFNFYPSCSRPEMVLGVKPHTDRSGLTVLLQDKRVEGLQILVNEKWVKVPGVPHALVINLGDQMQIMSNGVFKSPLHRVVTNSERMRISIALSSEPDPDREIGPADGLVDEQRPRLYRNVKNYGIINYECYQKGIVALETVKI